MTTETNKTNEPMTAEEFLFKEVDREVRRPSDALAFATTMTLRMEQYAAYVLDHYRASLRAAEVRIDLLSMGIVNDLYELAGVHPTRRQEINDEADAAVRDNLAKAATILDAAIAEVKKMNEQFKLNNSKG